MIRSTAIVLRYSAEVARLQSRYARIAATIRAEEANLLGWLAKLNRRLERRLVRVESLARGRKHDENASVIASQK